MFFGKRGDIHADWIIGMGLFIISVILMMVFLKPGIVPIREEGVALDLLIERFNGNFTRTVKTIPFFIQECTGVPDDGFTGGGSDGATGDVVFDFFMEGKDDFSNMITGLQGIGPGDVTPGTLECGDGEDNDGDEAIDYAGGPDGEPRDFSCGGLNDDNERFPIAQCQNGGDDDGDYLIDLADPGCANNQDDDETNPQLGLTTRVSMDLMNGWVFSKFVYSDDSNEWDSWFNLGAGNIVLGTGIVFYCEDDSDNNGDSMFFNIDAEDNAKFLFTYSNPGEVMPGRPLISYECTSDSTCAEFSARFGTEEDIVGLNIDRLYEFSPEVEDWADFDVVKSEWGIPESNNFWIQGWVEGAENCGGLDDPDCEYIVDYQTAYPSEVDDVKVEEVKTFILDEYGRLEDVVLFFRLW
ncbi:MAG: hypothetical protein ABIB47_06525 [Candidatus Woesearchaeota archaeon]